MLRFIINMNMKIYDNPPRSEWAQISRRPEKSAAELRSVVGDVIENIRCRGDEALREYEKLFDHTDLSDFSVNSEEIKKAGEQVSPELKEAIKLAAADISRFHEAQRFSPVRVETCRGVVCEQRAVPIEKVGLYIPGGTAPLFSTVLMLAIPARIAGCREIVLCTPPRPDGSCNPVVVWAAALSGVTHIYKAGGAQAIAAMALGTATVPKVDKIFGPGNQYVVAAKQLVSLENVAIDMPAGPSEVEVIADSSSNPVFVAADLLSQAEHGIDSQVILVGDDRKTVDRVMEEVERQLALLPRRDIAAQALEHSKAVILYSREEMADFSNVYAPEHLVISTDSYDDIASRITHAGSIFLGPWSCESAGDYASGTNHTLPTKGYARSYSGLCLDSFMRKLTLQHLSEDGVESIGRAVELMAEAEGLDAHRNAMTVRLKYLKDQKH